MNESHDGSNCFDISRPNIFGNPYTHIKTKKTKAEVVVKDRDTAIELYSEYFDQRLLNDNNFKAAWDRMYEAYKKYDTIYIGCYCHLDEKCHGDIIIKKLHQRAMKEILYNIRLERATKKST